MKQNVLYTKDIKKVDVTKEMKNKCFKKTKGYENTIGKVEKEGTIYYITFAEGYTAFGQKERKARKVTEVMWYSKIATEEKKKGFNLESTLKEFKDNGIIFDGKTIPEFIDTEKSLKTREFEKIKRSTKDETKK